MTRARKQGYCTLFVREALVDCQKAAELLTANGICFSKASVPGESQEFRDSDLPLLITGEGQWQGSGAIERYIRHALKESPKKH